MQSGNIATQNNHDLSAPGYQHTDWCQGNIG